MSISYLAMALQTKLPHAQKLVLLCLAEACNDWGYVTPGHKYLAHKTGASIRTIIRCLNALSEGGYIVEQKSKGRPTIYQLRGLEKTIPAISKNSELAEPEIDQPDYMPTWYVEEKPDVKEVSSSDNLSLVSECHYPLPPSFPPSSPPNGSFPHPSSFTPLLSPQSSPNTRSNSSSKNKIEYPADFEEFYAAYPRKVSKPQALKAWQKIEPDEDLKNLIIKKVTERKRKDLNWTKDGGTYIPYPASYLNARAWEDEFCQPASEGGKESGTQYRSLTGELLPWEK